MLVQILTKEELESFPTSCSGNFILSKDPYDFFPKERLEFCGKYAYAEFNFSGTVGNFYKLTPVNKEDESILDWNNELFSQREFRCIENSSHDPTPPAPISFDDLMKNM